MITTFGIPPLLTCVLILFVLPIMFLRAVRWKVVAEGLDLQLKTADAAGALCLSQLANLIIPGSLGDLVRIPYMTHRGNRMDRSIISILLDSVIGSIVPFAVGVMAIAVILQVNITIELFLLVLIWIFGGYCVYRIIRATLWSRFTQARLKRLMKEGITGRTFFTLPSMLTSIGHMRIAASLVFSIALFSLYVTQAYVLAIALGMSIEWTYLAISLGLTSLLIAIPVTIQGLGVREGVLLFMLAPLGIEPVVIISFSLTLMMINLVPAIAGFAIWTKNPFIDITSQVILDTEISDQPLIYPDGE
ncbi:MAG: flippase-like domain-containing protein [Candidatus Thorarchaeota archaeon]|nr:MAG: flippase-like domain-containing protein [Candidatus Thorarchaeota archaeon]